MDVTAFVGHSFTPNDADLVRRFTDYFTQVASMGNGFSWQHAEPAEPAELTQKVIRIFDQCNTFIGICSRKEFALAPSKKAKALFRPERSTVKNDELVWKTSDWVIQEIGYAVGKGMKVILLIEEGVRSPGGLQGNVEYISFSRSSPESSFGKFLEMLRALGNNGDKAPSTSLAIISTNTTADAAQTDDAAKGEDEGGHWLDGPIGIDWDLDKYRFAVRVAGYDRNIKRLNELVAAFSATSPAKKDKAIFDATVLSAQLENGMGGTLSALRTVYEQNPANADVASTMARSLAHFGENDAAARVFLETISSLDEDTSGTLEMLRGAAYQLAKAGNSEEAWSTVDRLRDLTPPDDRVEQTLTASTIRDVAEVLDAKPLYLAALERLASLAPDNEDMRFQLAYQHSVNGNDDLALLNYVRIAPSDRSSMTWNNLGVSYNRLDLEVMAVDAFVKSHEMGETLATSNLGNQYLKGGFAKAARELAVTTLSKEYAHPNLVDTLSRAEKANEKESSTVKRAIEKAAPKATFFREIGAAIVVKNIEVSKSQWLGKTYTLTVATRKNKLVANGTYVTEATNALTSLMMSSSEQKVAHKVNIVGTVHGRAVVGKRSVESDRKTQSLFSDSFSGQSIAMYFSEAHDILHLMTESGDVVESFTRVITSEIEA